MATRTTTIQQQWDVKENYYDQVLPKESDMLQPIRKMERRVGFVTPIIWSGAIIISLFHIIVISYFAYFLYSGRRCLRSTFVIQCIFGIMAGLGVTAGAHRLWTHKSYKVKKPVKILLLMFYATAGQNNLYNWVRDHRLHHKKSETSADPHDANRGFFFSHVGWLMMKKHPHVRTEGSKIDMSDITSDPMLVFFNRYFNILKFLFCFLIPIIVPVYLFGEELYVSVLSSFVRYIISLNATWSVNSFAHMHGLKPYDKDIMPSENNLVSIFALGEGWHNYHHTFPWDYKAAELPYFINLTTLFLDLLAFTGLVYDMKQASPSLIKAVAEKNGDDSRKLD
ncbi:acyl-CoA desaturase-like [Zerene cesonia]|uniref:acyl-CoA desaturase-like n=1 Tax=Zerene cesonia TaxID=33412 RepID=UPI0018E55A11|nr:acyl-CoA desaturase-like [Zerene cesonia]